MRIDILTLFPSMFYGVANSSIIQIAQQKKALDIRVSNIRNFAYDRHRTADDRPYGGGQGMLLKPEPIFRAVEAVWCHPNVTPHIILLSPQGQPFHQKMAEELSLKKHLIMICGHYEGVDERVRIGLKPQEISIGDYILTGGEIPAMVVLDSVIRLLPKVLGHEKSAVDESFSQGLLEYPQYTKPAVWREMEVPEIVKSGNHKKIEEWKHKMAKERTLQRRPDLLEGPFN